MEKKKVEGERERDIYIHIYSHGLEGAASAGQDSFLEIGQVM